MRVPWDSRWRPLTDFDAYWISNYGQVFNMRRGELVRPFINNHGVRCIHIYNGSRGTSRSLRKLTEKHWGLISEYQTQETAS